MPDQEPNFAQRARELLASDELDEWAVTEGRIADYRVAAQDRVTAALRETYTEGRRALEAELAAVRTELREAQACLRARADRQDAEAEQTPRLMGERDLARNQLGAAEAELEELRQVAGITADEQSARLQQELDAERFRADMYVGLHEQAQEAGCQVARQETALRAELARVREQGEGDPRLAREINAARGEVVGELEALRERVARLTGALQAVLASLDEVGPIIDFQTAVVTQEHLSEVLARMKEARWEARGALAEGAGEPDGN